MLALAGGYVAIAAKGATVTPSTALAPHDPIFIDGDAAFTAANGVTSGSGTSQDPYVISGWDISAAEADAIYVTATTASFVVRDVYLHSGLLKQTWPPGRGVVFDSMANGRVENATFSYNWVDVDASHSTGIVLSGNRFNGSNYGIHYQDTPGILLTGNVIVNATTGVEGTGSATIVNNRITGGDTGMYLVDDQGTITSNRVEYATTGMEILGANTVASVFGNNLSRDGTGIHVWGQTNVRLFHNNFLYDRIPAIDDRAYGEDWDDGYPSGGNYWTDYTGADQCSGVYQDVCPDPDGIGDVPYLVDSDTRDFYPLMQPFVVPNRAPVVGPVEATPAAAIPGEDVAFRTNVTDPDGDLLSFTWDFGDGGSAGGLSGPVATIEGVHAYGGAGAYVVTVTVDDGRGGHTVVSNETTVVEPGLLHVRTEIDRHPDWGVPGTILVDGVPRSRWGLNWVKIAPGPHTVSFTDVPGLGTPAPASVEVVSGTTTDVVATYVAWGWLRVNTTPAAPVLIEIDGIPRTMMGLWTSMPAGTYNVSVGPNYAIVQVAPEATTFVNVSSEGAPRIYQGYLWVETNPVVPTRISVNGIPRNDWKVLLPMPDGYATVTTSDVPGYTTPPPSTTYVSTQYGAIVYPQFERLGLLRATTDPALAATIFVDGRPANDWFLELPLLGTHKVSFGPVPGYAIPFGEWVAVAAGDEVNVTGTYVPTSGAMLAAPTSLGPYRIEAKTAEKE